MSGRRRAPYNGWISSRERRRQLATGVGRPAQPAPSPQQQRHLDAACYVDVTDDVQRAYLELCTCCICKDVCLDISLLPYCSHPVCYTCLDHMSSTSRPLQCPMRCAGQFHISDCRINATSVQCIVNIALKCPNFTSGCTAHVTLGSAQHHLQRHLAESAYERVSCANDGCQHEELRKDWTTAQHKRTCSHRLITCSHCSSVYSVPEYAEHSSGELPCVNLIYCPNECPATKDDEKYFMQDDSVDQLSSKHHRVDDDTRWHTVGEGHKPLLIRSARLIDSSRACARSRVNMLLKRADVLTRMCGDEAVLM